MVQRIHKTGIALITALLTMTAIAFATPVQNVTRGATVTNVTFNGPSGDNMALHGGNITTVNVSGQIATTVWVGVKGNVTHTLALGGGTDTFYQWSTPVDSSGTVLFSNASSVTWPSIAAGTGANSAQEDAFLGLNTSREDNVTNTLSLTNSNAIDLGGVNIGVGAAESVNTTSNGGNAWETVLLVQGSTKVYAGPIQQANQDYTGSLSDFQVMVPVNSTGGPRTYYLFADLS